MQDDIVKILPADIPCGDNNAFTKTINSFYRITLQKDNYICQRCHQQIKFKWRMSGNHKLITNSIHHIISQNLAEWCNHNELKTLLANGITYCDNCHFIEHRKIGGYEFGGALNLTFPKLKGLEDLSDRSVHTVALSNPTVYYLYDILLDIIKNNFDESSNDIEGNNISYDKKALAAFSNQFYLALGVILEDNGWENLSQYKRHELLDIVNHANEFWLNEYVQPTIKKYNRKIKASLS